MSDVRPSPTGSPSVPPTGSQGGSASGAQAARPEDRSQGQSQPPARRGGSELLTDKGRTSIADSVVQKIAGVSAREVSGVHAMGAGRARTFGAIKERIPGSSGPSVSQGVSVEVGERQAAIDLDLVVEYGVSIVDVAQAVRQNVIGSIERMTGLEVTEVNVAVDDVYMGDDAEPEQPRVQ